MSPILVLVATVFGSAQVDGGSGSAARLQAAIDACPASGCEIELTDSVYRMENQVWIQDKEGVRLRSTGTVPAKLRWEDSLLVPDTSGTAALFRLRPLPGAGRPALPSGWLRWPSAYKGGEGTIVDSTNPWASSGHQHNGMILVKNSRGVRLEGLVLDGIRPAIFANKAVWSQMYDLVHGSVGVGIIQSRGVEIVRGELRGFWAAIYMNDRNLSCASWSAGAKAKPWTECGTMGNHLVEGSRIHHNKFGIYSEAAWDLGSVFRDNLAWSNGDLPATETVTSRSAAASSDNLDNAGGFLHVKDVVFPAHVATRNTIADTGSSRPYGWAYYRAAANALWSDNLVEMKGSTKSVYSNPLTHFLHVFTGAKSPHLWNLGLISGYQSLLGLSGAQLFDSSFHWAAKRAVPRDTLDGESSGGLYTSIPGDTVDTLIGGVATRAPRMRWVTILFDTTLIDTTCRTGCWFGFDTTMRFPYSGSFISWYGRPRGGDTVQARFVIPDGRIETRKFTYRDVCDSTTGFRLSNEKDTLAAWTKNLTNSANARFVSTDPSNPAFLTLDTTLRGARDLLRRHGGMRSRVGALGVDGQSHQEPIRLRTRGHGQLDKTKGELLLPVAITGRLEGVSRLVVRRIWVAARPLDPNRVDASTPDMIERRVLPLTLSDILPTDTLIRVPFTDAGADSLYQVDLWLAAIAGSDTLDVTPMAWSASSVMGTSRTTSGIGQKTSNLSWRRDGRFLVLLDGGPRRSLAFFDSRGARFEIQVGTTSRGSTVDLAGLPRGVWLPSLPGGRPIAAAGR
ncbi:MAG: hypothetical protein AAB214_19645 [Fibrobacterota bacterium]